MNPIVLIPARMASSRLPGKPLATIADKMMSANADGRFVHKDGTPYLES